MTADESDGSSGDLSGDLVAVRAACEGTSEGMSDRERGINGRKWRKIGDRVQDHNMTPFLE